ncbi:DUF1236 domain-containing protein [Xanthobacter sp. DSM 24535]|uniref:DUF1236 domain-containing protein n=1 Tax=Roseixanthobacter psychrophilus TaxID=3119917 RepID=UPI003728BAB1
MNTHFLGAAGALALVLGASSAGAQTSVVIVTQPSGYVVVTPEQQVQIQRYVVQQPRAEVFVMPPDFAPVTGTVMPQEVQLYSFAPDGSYGGFDAARYRYVVMPDNQTILVEPSTRQIIEVIR